MRFAFLSLLRLWTPSQFWYNISYISYGMMFRVNTTRKAYVQSSLNEKEALQYDLPTTFASRLWFWSLKSQSSRFRIGNRMKEIPIWSSGPNCPKLPAESEALPTGPYMSRYRSAYSQNSISCRRSRCHPLKQVDKMLLIFSTVPLESSLLEGQQSLYIIVSYGQLQ